MSGRATNSAIISSAQSIAEAAAIANATLDEQAHRQADGRLLGSRRQPRAERGATRQADDEDRHHQAERKGRWPEDEASRRVHTTCSVSEAKPGHAERDGGQPRSRLGGLCLREEARLCLRLALLWCGSNRQGLVARRSRSRDRKCSTRGDHVQHHADPRRSAQTKCGNQHETREHRAGRGAECVGGVQAAGVLRRARRVPHDPP